MGRGQRGYITFLLLVQWAYLLLIPYLFTPLQTASLLPAYSAQRVLAEEIAFKRAARAAASGDFHKVALAAKTGQDVAEFFDIPPTAYHQLTHAKIQNATRQLILLDWAALSSQWGPKTGFNASITCPVSPSCGSLLQLSRNSTRLMLQDGIEIQIQSADSNLGAVSTLSPGDVDS